MLALTCLTLALHWVQKSPCQDGAWQNNIQYTRFCYTDVLALYYAEGLNEGKVPYRRPPGRVPGAHRLLHGRARPAGARPRRRRTPTINQGQWFYNLNALVLGALAVATVAVILALRRRRPWDAAMFALSPALLLTATVNWDLLAIGLAAFGLLRLGEATTGRWPGVLLGLGGAAKLWPLFLLGPILVLGAAGRPAAAPRSPPSAPAVVALVAVNLPVALPLPGQLGPVLRAQHHPADRLGHALVHRALPRRQGGTPARPATRARSSG